jgi:purine-binding chemotaxis protein CheW
VDVLLFQVHDQIYAVDADAVREVVDPVPVTPLPFVAPEVEGLVNISGRVIPQICVAIRLNLGTGMSAGEGAVMLLTAAERLCACRVSKVVAKITIEEESVSRCAVAEAGQDRLLAGEFTWNGRLVILLDPSAMMMEQGERLGSDSDGNGLLADVATDVLVAEKNLANEFSCVLFSCCNELFAFRFDDVAEVVESGQITALPGAPPEMVGLLLLRGFPLPVVSMQALLFGGSGKSTPYTLVVDLNGCPMGLQVERVLGIQRFPVGSLRPLLEEQSLLEGFVTTKDNRLVGLIRFAAFSEPERLAAWRPFLIAADSAAAATTGQVAQTERVLMFRQGREMMAVPLASVERIEEYSEPTETPGSGSSSICGVIQVQGNVTPVVRLERLTGVAAGTPSAYLIMREGEGRIAVPVEKVEKVVNLRGQDIDPVRSGQNNLLSGVGKYEGTLVSLICVERLMPA